MRASVLLLALAACGGAVAAPQDAAPVGPGDTETPDSQPGQPDAGPDVQPVLIDSGADAGACLCCDFDLVRYTACQADYSKAEWQFCHAAISVCTGLMCTGQQCR
jgi:hypothetical protein